MWRWKLTRRANICRKNMAKEWQSIVCWIMQRLLTIFISAWWLTVAFSLAFTRLKYFPEAQISPLPFSWHGVENLIHCTGETALAMVMASYSSPGRQIIELSNVFPNLQRNIFLRRLHAAPPHSPSLYPPVEIFLSYRADYRCQTCFQICRKSGASDIKIAFSWQILNFMKWTKNEAGSRCLSLSMIFTMTKSGSVSHNSSN